MEIHGIIQELERTDWYGTADTQQLRTIAHCIKNMERTLLSLDPEQRYEIMKGLADPNGAAPTLIHLLTMGTP